MRYTDVVEGIFGVMNILQKKKPKLNIEARAGYYGKVTTLNYLLTGSLISISFEAKDSDIFLMITLILCS